MFSSLELSVIASALVVQEKSVGRLAAKDGQPESVANEYRKVAESIRVVMRHVQEEAHKLAMVKVK